MDGTGQGKMIFLQITDHIGESMIAVAFGIKVFVSGNDPFDPSLRSHSIVAAFRAGQIQPFAEMLPRLKRIQKPKKRKPMLKRLLLKPKLKKKKSKRPKLLKRK